MRLATELEIGCNGASYGLSKATVQLPVCQGVSVQARDEAAIVQARDESASMGTIS